MSILDEDFRCDDCHEEVPEQARCQLCRNSPRTRLDHETGKVLVEEATANRCVRCCRYHQRQVAQDVPKGDPVPECPRCGRLVQDCPRARFAAKEGRDGFREDRLECLSYQYLTRALQAEEERDAIKAHLEETERLGVLAGNAIDIADRGLGTLTRERDMALAERDAVVADRVATKQELDTERQARAKAEQQRDAKHVEVTRLRGRLREVAAARAELEQERESRATNVAALADAGEMLSAARVKIAQLEDACSNWAREVVDVKRHLDVAREQVKLAEAEMAKQREARILAENERAKAQERADRVAAIEEWIDRAIDDLLALREEGDRTVRYLNAAHDDIATRRLPPSRPSSGPVIAGLVAADIFARAAEGEREYEQPLRAFNGRPAGIDAYHESLDLPQYLRQLLEEMRAMLRRVRDAIQDATYRNHVPHILLADIERWLAPYEAQLGQNAAPEVKPEWIDVATSPPKDGEVVYTKIDDTHGVRNEQPLIRRGNLWWLSDGTMRCYYRPTHWRPLADGDHERTTASVIAEIERCLTPEQPARAQQPVDGHPTPEWARRCTYNTGVGPGFVPCGNPALPDTDLPRCAEHASKYRPIAHAVAVVSACAFPECGSPAEPNSNLCVRHQVNF